MTQNLHDLDLNLLRSLGDLLEAVHVTRAAERAGVAQPVMSRNLAKLRALLKDPLLVPIGRRLELSPRARALKPKVQNMLAAVREVLEPPEPFDATRASGLVRVAAHDYTVGPVIKRFVLSLRTQAPGLSVHVAPAAVESLSALAEGELDLAIGPSVSGAMTAGVERFVMRPFVDATPSCVMRKGHPSLRRRWDLSAFCRVEHVTVSSEKPGPSMIDRALALRRAQRRTVLAVPSVGAALSLVADSDLVAVVPSSHLRDYGLSLTTRPVPVTLTDTATYVLWSPRSTHDPRHRWLRAQLFAAGSMRTRSRDADGGDEGE